MEAITKKLHEIQSKLKAPKNQLNKFGGYNYRSCEDITEAVKPLLGDCVLLITDDIICLGTGGVIHKTFTDSKGNITQMQAPDSRYYVKATATLSLGKEQISVSGFARESFDKKGMDDSQITGSASSYARKYALNGLFAIDDTKDADTGNNGNQEQNNIPQNNAQTTGNFKQDFYNQPPQQNQQPQQQTPSAQPDSFIPQGNLKVPPFSNPATEPIINALCDFYQTQQTEHYRFSREKLLWAIWQRFGKWPVKDTAVFAVKQSISFMDVCDDIKAA